MPVSRAMRSQLRRRRRARPGVLAAVTTPTITDAPASASRRAATYPSPPLLPGPHRITIGPVPHRPEVDGKRPDRCRDRGPGVLHQAFLWDADRLGASVRPDHRRARDRRERGATPPNADASPRRSSSKIAGSLAGSAGAGSTVVGIALEA